MDKKDLLEFNKAEEKAKAEKEAEEKAEAEKKEAAESEKKEKEEKKEAKKAARRKAREAKATIKVTKGQLALFLAAVIFLMAIIITGTVCVVNKETPVQLFEDVFMTDSTKVVGSWQGDQARRGIIFYEDKTCKIYSFGADSAIRKDYEIRGNKINIYDYKSGGSIVYRYTVTNDVLTMTIVEENGKKREGGDVYKYDRVKHLNLKTAEEIMKDIADDARENEE